MILDAHHSRKFEPTRNLPEGYLECGNAQLAYDPVKCQYVWPGGKRMIGSEARVNVEYLDRIISGELPMAINESGYASI